MTPAVLPGAPAPEQVCVCVCFITPCVGDDPLPFFAGDVAPSSPAGPEYADERDELLGNEDNIPVEDEEEGEELFGDDFER